MELVQVQRLHREVAHQRRRARVSQHAQRLGLQRARSAQGAAGSGCDECLVRSLTPQKERQARCQLEIRQPAGRLHGAIQEVGAHEDGRNQLLDAGVEPTVGGGLRRTRALPASLLVFAARCHRRGAPSVA